MKLDYKDVNIVLETLVNSDGKQIRSWDNVFIETLKLPKEYVEKIILFIKEEKPVFISSSNRPGVGVVGTMINGRENDIRYFLNNGGFKKEPTYTLELNKNVAELINQMREAKATLPPVEPIDPEILNLFDTSRITGSPKTITNIDNSTHIHAPVTNSNITQTFNSSNITNVEQGVQENEPKKSKSILEIVSWIAGIIGTIIAAYTLFKN